MAAYYLYVLTLGIERMTSRQRKSASKQTQHDHAHELLAAMIASAKEKQQQFIEVQFKTV